MRKGVVALAALTSLIFLVSGCGSDGDDQSSTAVHKEFISYDLVRNQSAFAESSGTQSVGIDPGEDVINWSLNIACLAIPELLPAKKFAKFTEKAFEKSKLKSETTELLSALQAMQGEIAQLQSDVSYLSQDFYAFVNAETFNDFKLSMTDYNSSYQKFMGNASNYLLALSNGLVVDAEDNTTIDFNATIKNIATMNAEMAQVGSFVQDIDDVSGTSLDETYDQPDLYKRVAADSGSKLVTMYGQYQRYLLINYVPQMPTDINSTYDANASLAMTLDTYNDNITAVFQSAVQALQVGYTANSLINQINYAQGVLAPDASPLNPYESNLRLYYKYDADQNASANYDVFKAAQTELALVYAARLNILIETTLSYIYSDLPLRDFTYPSMKTENETLNKIYGDGNYSTFYDNMASSTDLNGSKVGMHNRVFPIINVEDGGGYIHYMYQGFNQFTACQNAVVNNGEINTTSCPPLYEGYAPSETPGYYSGRYLSVWLYNPTAKKAVMTSDTLLDSVPDGNGTDLYYRCASGAYAAVSGDAVWTLDAVSTSGSQKTGFNCPVNTALFEGGNGYFTNDWYTPDWYYDVSSLDTDATFYFATTSDVNFTYSEQWEGNVNKKHSGIKTHEGTKVFFIDTAKFVEYYDNEFELAMDVDGYSTSVEIDLNQDQHGFNTHNHFTLRCNGYDPVCEAQSDGLCVGGKKIILEKDGNTAKVVHQGGC